MTFPLSLSLSPYFFLSFSFPLCFSSSSSSTFSSLPVSFSLQSLQAMSRHVYCYFSLLFYLFISLSLSFPSSLHLYSVLFSMFKSNPLSATQHQCPQGWLFSWKSLPSVLNFDLALQLCTSVVLVFFFLVFLQRQSQPSLVILIMANYQKIPKFAQRFKTIKPVEVAQKLEELTHTYKKKYLPSYIKA